MGRPSPARTTMIRKFAASKEYKKFIPGRAKSKKSCSSPPALEPPAPPPLVISIPSPTSTNCTTCATQDLFPIFEEESFDSFNEFF